jgi:hypothetical protein
VKLLNTILVSFLRSRIKGIEWYKNNPHEAQEKVFEYLISKAKNTGWGKQHNYREIRNTEDFRKNVPLSTYEQFAPYVDRVMKGEQNLLWSTPITWFSKSSGTTNAKSKFIPVSKESLHDCHYKGGKDLICAYLNNNPASEMFHGKGLAIGGTYSPNTLSPNSFYGDVSAVIMANLPGWAEYVRTPSIATALMSEWESKIEKIANETINKRVTNISGVPTWTIVLLERILEITGKRNMLEVWPHFEVFYHGAVAFNPYRAMFKKLFPGDQVNYVETYNASEGFFGLQDELNSDQMLLMLDYGIYYEFIPVQYADEENPPVLSLDQVEKDKIYALVISTNGGLWRYKIGDTIKFTSVNPYRIKITGRTKHFINAFGEELMIENAETAITKASRLTNSVIANFTAAPVYFGDNKKGGHEWIIEFNSPPSSIQEFTRILDESLKEINSDYEAKRYKDLALQMPVVHIAEPGTFYNWMKKRGKLGAQNKVPRLSNTREFVDDILSSLSSLKS